MTKLPPLVLFSVFPPSNQVLSSGVLAEASSDWLAVLAAKSFEFEIRGGRHGRSGFLVAVMHEAGGGRSRQAKFTFSFFIPEV